MTNKEYQSNYKKLYNEKNKIVTFPLSNIFYEELNKRAVIVDVKANTFAKNIVTAFLNNNVPKSLTTEEKKLIKDYIQISRGIANNINQIAHKTNLGEQVDINILISSLQKYEEEFKRFVIKV